MFDRYKIENEDTITLIAKKFGTTTENLKTINDIYSLENLRVGSDIIVPKIDEVYYNVKKIKKGGSLQKIAKELNINPNLFASMNGFNITDYIYNNQEVLIPKSDYSYYITSEGDTIKTASEIFGVSKERILSQNQTIYLLRDQIIANKKIWKLNKIEKDYIKNLFFMLYYIKGIGINSDTKKTIRFIDKEF